MWFVIADVQKMTRKSAPELQKAVASGQLRSRLNKDGMLEIELSSVLSAFAGEQAGATGVDEMSQRIGQQWNGFWRRNSVR